jgi:hypothetical protein
VSDGGAGRALDEACRVMHDAYEAAACGVGWETQKASRVPWEEVPEANKQTMRAAVTALLAYLEADPRRAETLYHPSKGTTA